MPHFLNNYNSNEQLHYLANIIEPLNLFVKQGDHKNNQYIANIIVNHA